MTDDLSEFERNFNELQSDLSKWISSNETHVNLLIYESYQFYFIDINNVFSRIENEARVIGIAKNPEEVKEEDYLDSLRNFAKNLTSTQKTNICAEMEKSPTMKSKLFRK